MGSSSGIWGPIWDTLGIDVRPWAHNLLGASCKPNKADKADKPNKADKADKADK